MRTKTKSVTVKELAELITIDGFVKTVEDDKDYGCKVVKLESEAQKIRFEMFLYPTQEKWDREEYGAVRVDGHTHFEIEGRGWVTFDRTGVEDSFYCGAKSFADVLKTQLSKIVGSRERAKTTQPLPTPLGNFYRTEEEIKELKVELKKKGYVDFHPSGFGIGYHVVTRRTSWAKPAQALSAFFGFPVYYETMDCD